MDLKQLLSGNGELYEDDLTLLHKLGLRMLPEILLYGQETELGTVTVYWGKDGTRGKDEGRTAGTVKICVTACPTKFWQFYITRDKSHDMQKEDPSWTVRTGSGSLAEYWPSVCLMIQGMFYVKEGIVPDDGS